MRPAERKRAGEAEDYQNKRKDEDILSGFKERLAYFVTRHGGPSYRKRRKNLTPGSIGSMIVFVFLQRKQIFTAEPTEIIYHLDRAASRRSSPARFLYPPKSAPNRR